jgi:hypothetical protein
MSSFDAHDRRMIRSFGVDQQQLSIAPRKFISLRDAISAGERTHGQAAAVNCAARRITSSANEFRIEAEETARLADG